jgi:hypothetical protein
MRRFLTILIAIFLALPAAIALAQSNSPQPESESGPQTPASTGAVPAYGQNEIGISSENPPLTGLDQPSLEPRATTRSFLLPGLHVSESVDSNIEGTSGNVAVRGVTRALGTLFLQRLWGHYETDLEYVGGAGFYTFRGHSAHLLQQLNAGQRVMWRTGQLAIRDSFSYLPEGQFGFGAYGGAGSFNGGLGGGIGNLGGMAGNALGGIFGAGQFGSLGQEPRITNTAVLDVAQALSRRSSVTAAGSYGVVHFIDDTAGFVNSRQIAAQAGYNYQLSRKDHVALAYGFQRFEYPKFAGSAFRTNVVNALYGRRISGRLDFLIGGGPQFTTINNPLLGPTQSVSGTGRVRLRYRFPRTTLGLSYARHNTAGSGFFLGATSDIAELTLERPINRVWSMTADVGYTRSSRVQPAIASISAKNFEYVFAGGAVHRPLGRQFRLFISYQFNDLKFDDTCTSLSGSCAGTSQRHVASVGLDWHPRPIRLD